MHLLVWVSYGNLAREIMSKIHNTNLRNIINIFIYLHNRWLSYNVESPLNNIDIRRDFYLKEKTALFNIDLRLQLIVDMFFFYWINICLFLILDIRMYNINYINKFTQLLHFIFHLYINTFTNNNTKMFGCHLEMP